MSSYLGVDVAKTKLDICLLKADKVASQAQFENSNKGIEKLLEWLLRHKIKETHVCLEATGRYSDAVARSLHDAGYEVSVVNPAQIKSYARSQLKRNKTDRLDAALIADFCHTQNPPLWIPPDPALAELTALVRHYDNLMESRQQQINRLKAGATTALVIEQLQLQIELLSQQIKAVKEAIEQLLEQNPKLKTQSHLLLSIPGIGQLTAAKILAEFPQMESFQNVRQLVAFAGLNPRHRESGSSVRGYTRISKMGRSSLRAALYMPALTAMRFNPRLANYAQRLRECGLKGKAVVVAIMRKLLHLAYGILKSGRSYDPNYLDKMLAFT